MSAQYYRLLQPHLPENKTSAVLDVGCGMGFAMDALLKLGYQQVEGFDTDKNQITLAKNAGLAVRQVEDSLSFLQTQTGNKDLILFLVFL